MSASPTSRCAACCALTLLLGLGSEGWSQALCYVRRASARDTWDASIKASQEFGLRLGPWHYVGPFDHTKRCGFDAACPPEKRVDLKASYEGKGKRTVTWQQGKRFRDGHVNSLRIFDDNDWIAVYLYRVIESTAAQSLTVSLGSDDTLTVWLNRERLLARNVTRACRPDDDAVTLKLRRGRNELLMKVCQGGGPSGFYFNLGSRQQLESELLQRVAADFPDEALGLMVVLDWERQDGVADDPGRLPQASRQLLGMCRALLDELGRAKLGLIFDHAQADLVRLESQAKSQPSRPAEAWLPLYRQTRRLRRRVALANPLLDFDRLLLVKGRPPLYSHMCDQYLGRHSRAGAGIYLLESLRRGGPARCVVGVDRGQLPPGAYMHAEVSFDGTRVLFAYCDHTPRRNERRFHLYECRVDGTELRQLTHGPDEDFDACYLPDRGIMFVSTRNHAFGRCHGGRYTPSYVLYTMDGDGGNIRRVSFGEANEWNPSVLHDGRVIYTRWDYINRHDSLFQSLWVTGPQGAGTEVFYGNATRNPCMTAEPRAIPGSHKVSALATAHHSYTAGSIITVDRRLGVDGKEPIARVTPEVRFPETEGWPKGSYASPYPLSEDYYLAAYSADQHIHQGRVARGNAYGLYLVDVFGGRELIYRDPNESCMEVMPAVAGPRPPTLPSRVAAGQKEGVFLLQDVTEGLEDVKAGDIRHLRVVEIMAQPTARVPVRSAAQNEVVKRVLGTVPVAADGSACFHAPACVPLAFHALDERFMAVQIMRSQVYLQPGERAGCVGCHEPRHTPPLRRFPAAATRRPASITPPPGPRGRHGLSFARTVQPVLDRYCIRCHGLKAKKAGLCLLGEREGSFNVAYNALVARAGLVSVAQRNREKAVSTPRLYGAHAGRLVQVLLCGHKDRVQLNVASFRRIVAWLDLNAQYYGDYSFDRPERRPLNKDADRLVRSLVRKACARCHPNMPQLPASALYNVALPGESRVLMAPLSEANRGWGQCKETFPDQSHPTYDALLSAIRSGVPAGARKTARSN